MATRFLLILIVICMCGVARADDDTIKYAIQDCQQHADNARDTMGNLETAYGTSGDFTAGDLVLMDHDYKISIAAWEQALAAFQKGDAVKGQELRAAAIKAAPPIDWSRRLQYRQRMYYLDLNDRWVLAFASWTTPRALPAFSAWVKAKKKCSRAWALACESMTDDTDPIRPTPAAEIQAVEAAKAADIEEETARWDYELAKEIYNDLLRDKDVASPQLDAAVQKLQDLEKQRVALHLEDIEHDRRSREFERQMQQAQLEATKARDDAQKARNQAAQNVH